MKIDASARGTAIGGAFASVATGAEALFWNPAGIIGSIIPPSMVMIVCGAMAGVSIGGLFLAGIIPGLLITTALMGTIYLHSFRPAFPELRQTTGRYSFKRVIKAIPNVWVALLAPVIILGGILGGIFTATEAGVVACIYSFHRYITGINVNQFHV